MSDDCSPYVGGPFSALTPSMWPQDLLQRIADAPETPDGQLDYRYDEFGFRVEEEDGPEQNSSKLLSTPFVEDAESRQRWITHLEMTYGTLLGGEATDDNEVTEDGGVLNWSKLPLRLQQSEKLHSMVKEGIPHSLRANIWLRLSGALEKREKSANSYNEIVKASSMDHLVTSRHIEKDLLRTLPSNACFSALTSTGVPRLRRVLRSLAWLYPDIGYCQGTGVIAAALLLFMEEEDSFWLMTALIEHYLPASYYTTSLLGVQADQKVLRELLPNFLPKVDQVLKEHDIELSLITLHWFLTIFGGVLHIRVLLRIWDLFFYNGSVVLFHTTLAILKMKETELSELDNSAQIFNCLSGAPSTVHDVEELMQMIIDISGSSLSETMIDSHRRKHLAYLMADEGALLNPECTRNLPKQQLNKRQLRRSRSLISSLLWGEIEQDDSMSDPKAKNVQQTELLVTLREAIHQIARHFKSLDPKHGHVSLQADYSLESHAEDLEHYVQVARNRRRRAKALLDFERHDDDELGFRKNDIITVISMRDEHCWVGELNGLRGWFPAKFVELLDERSKDYSTAGDDAVNDTITDLVRGCLCPALKAILEHGLKRSSLLGSSCHPWLFIEEAATKEVEKDFDSVYSRLILCKTFRLDEDGKVLTPEEILYRAVQTVNLTHDAAHAQMDVKLRSLICYGLNEQVLHLWLEALCSCVEVVEKWYQPWSYLRSPGWVQIKCELRLLSQFALRLNLSYELPKAKVSRDMRMGIKEDVRDMLIKHHLFSWELD